MSFTVPDEHALTQVKKAVNSGKLFDNACLCIT